MMFLSADQEYKNVNIVYSDKINSFELVLYIIMQIAIN